MNPSVLITGSSRGLGKAIALSLSQDAYSVVVHCRSKRDEADRVADTIRTQGGQSRVLQFDVGDREAAKAALSEDIEKHGAYYGVVCNAGITSDASFPAFVDDDWDRVINTNLNSFYNVLHPLTMPMIQRRAPGRIITVASMSGITGNRGQVNYSASKGGIIAATKALAVELAKRKITVNCVVPGIFETDMVKEARLSLDQLSKLIPMERLGAPEDITGIVRFLLSDQSSYITRQVISVNGGML
ncbi:MAG: 3-oxoacyl-ACP reductase FabG [Kiritimatiellae bacterium]|nr:3-oxoacyl-ACP reductase FabG [Kiritimatiellia bacterium]